MAIKMNENEMREKFEGLITNILLRAKERLEELNHDDFPYDFNSNAIHDIIHDEVDHFVAGMGRVEWIEWIDYLDNENYIDKGLIDTSNINRTLLTTAYACIELAVFDNEIIYDLQEYEMTEDLRNEFVRRIDELLGDTEYTVGEDNETQIFIEFDFDLSEEDFKQQYFAEGQVTELGDNVIKIFTCNYAMNRNAIVIEKVRDAIHRVYLMEKDKDVDIRKFFSYIPSIAETGYNLSPEIYVNGKLKKKFDDKKELLYYLARMANELLNKTEKERRE